MSIKCFHIILYMYVTVYLHYYLPAILMCLPCPHVTIHHLIITNTLVTWDIWKLCLLFGLTFHVGNKSCCVLWGFLPAFSFVSLSFWCSSELKPGVNNRAHSILHSFSKASPPKACLTSSSWRLFRPIIYRSVFCLFSFLRFRLQLHLQFVMFGLNYIGTKFDFFVFFLYSVQFSFHRPITTTICKHKSHGSANSMSVGQFLESAKLEI